MDQDLTAQDTAGITTTSTEETSPEDIEAYLSDLEQRITTARDHVIAAQRECDDWIKRARKDIAETRHEVEALQIELVLQKHREALHALQREFDQTLRDHRRDVADLRREAHEIKGAMALDVSQYRRDMEALRSSMTGEFDRSLRLQQSWQAATRGLSRIGGGFGLSGILQVIGAIVVILFLCAGSGHLITLLTSLHP